MDDINTSDVTICNQCPRHCNVNRNIKTGFCGMHNDVYIARAALHMWEEPCISGEEGSGTVFFTGCTLKCVFCQNYEIAEGKRGKSVTISELADIFIKLQKDGANNINLVTPTHYTESIISAVKIAKEKGLLIPIVYNTSGYETLENLRKLEGIVDIYLPDFKYMSRKLAKKYSRAEDYPVVAKEALEEMFRQTGVPQYDQRGMMKKGVIVRHLILPGCIQDSMEVVKYLYHTYKDNIVISIMNQYTPLSHVKDIPELNRKVTEKEYDTVVDYAIELGVENAFIQEGDTADDSFIPDFDCTT